MEAVFYREVDQVHPELPGLGREFLQARLDSGGQLVAIAGSAILKHQEVERSRPGDSQEARKRRGMANRYGNLGLIYRTREELDQVEEALLKALKLSSTPRHGRRWR